MDWNRIPRILVGLASPLALWYGLRGVRLALKGKYPASETSLRRELAINERAFGPEDRGTATCLNSLALLLQLRGDLLGAEPLSRRALAIREKVRGPEHPDTAWSLDNLAMLLLEKGDLAGAEPLSRRALAITEKARGPGHPHTANSLGRLARVLHAKGDLVGAEPLYSRALAISEMARGLQHRDTAVCLNNLALLLRDKGDLAGAEPLSRRALEIGEKALGPEHPNTAAYLNNLAMLLNANGDLAGAEPFCRRALAISEKTLGPHHPQIALALFNLALLCHRGGRSEEAFELLARACAIEQRLFVPILAAASEREALLYLRSQQWAWQALLSLAVERFRTDSRRVGVALDVILGRKALLLEMGAGRRGAVLRTRYPEHADAIERLWELRRRIARKTLDGPGRDEDPAAHAKRLEEWREQREAMEAELARKIPDLALEQRLQAADRPAVAVALPEGSRLVEFVQYQPVDFAAGQWLPARYAAFVLVAGEPQGARLVDLGAAKPIDELIATFRAAMAPKRDEQRARGSELNQPKRLADLAASGGALREKVYEPLRSCLGDGGWALIAADGNLSLLPFEALPGPKGYLADQYQFTYLSAGRDVLRLQPAAGDDGSQRGPRAGRPLIVANPAYQMGEDAQQAVEESGKEAKTAADSRQSRDLRNGKLRFDSLPGTAAEAKKIQRHLRFLGPEVRDTIHALKGPLRQERSPLILHLATHGFFLEDQPLPEPESLERPLRPAEGWGRLQGPGMENPLLRSGLAMAGAQTYLDHGFASLPAAAEDGLLNADDVVGLDLIDTELVVTSACDTALGDVQAGEGVMGLRRAFVLAGAKSMVMSLWRVDDGVAVETMDRYYHHLLNGEGRAKALQLAREEIRRRYPDPYYWASLIFLGNPSPIFE